MEEDADLFKGRYFILLAFSLISWAAVFFAG
jgi:hypothetical protein